MRAARVCRSGRLWSTSASTRLPERRIGRQMPQKARRIVYGQLEGTVLYDRAVIAQADPGSSHRVKQTAPYRLSKGQQNKQNNASQAGQQEQPGRTSFPLGGRTAVAAPVTVALHSTSPFAAGCWPPSFPSPARPYTVEPRSHRQVPSNSNPCSTVWSVGPSRHPDSIQTA